MQPRNGCSLMQPVQAFATFPCFRFTNTVDLFSIGITPPYKTSLSPRLWEIPQPRTACFALIFG